jgi:ATP-binding cassette subfamily C (CFTR/MRP) protein 1
MISSLVLFAVYAAQAHLGKAPPLTAAKAFTSLALINLMIAPAGQLMAGITTILSASACVDRIQKFLQSVIYERREPKGKPNEKNDHAMITARQVALGVPSENEPNPIDLELSKGSVTMIVGPVGCGKSTLLKVLLGETNQKSGSVSVDTTRIGYCSPKPWLRNDTIKNNILSSNSWDEAWYTAILRVCDLQRDLLQMPNGDDTLVGSRGITLSGGQKHRVALARALYARCPLLLLDDPFASLDRKTRRRIASRLFGADEFIRKHEITVVFVSHESECSVSKSSSNH